MKNNQQHTNDYLEILEQAKKQYQQYLEVSQLHELPIQKEKEQSQQQLSTSSTLDFVRE